MNIEEKRELMAKGAELVRAKHVSVDAKGVLMRLIAGWTSDLNNSTEGKQQRDKVDLGILTKSMEGITIEEAKDRIAVISLMVGKIMRSGMQLHSVFNGDPDEFDIEDMLDCADAHLLVLEEVFDAKLPETDTIKE